MAPAWRAVPESSDFTLDLMLARLTKEQRAEAEKAADGWRNGRLSE